MTCESCRRGCVGDGDRDAVARHGCVYLAAFPVLRLAVRVALLAPVAVLRKLRKGRVRILPSLPFKATRRHGLVGVELFEHAPCVLRLRPNRYRRGVVAHRRAKVAFDISPDVAVEPLLCKSPFGELLVHDRELPLRRHVAGAVPAAEPTRLNVVTKPPREFLRGRNVALGLEEERLEYRRSARLRTSEAFPLRVIKRFRLDDGLANHHEESGYFIRFSELLTHERERALGNFAPKPQKVAGTRETDIFTVLLHAHIIPYICILFNCNCNKYAIYPTPWESHLPPCFREQEML